ncbi:cyanoexosortase A system-associated protein [Anabaena azotica]|uniref:Cyanoexosortase A system-associated protein n=1 Tax=Anabaena azotica FACHB-119 TaxID=947527 RepID=A0ABR8D8W6_9NOST|nr:cyanoexosortase A system-associated protein [Anabaena azotica]MBD2503650.1 cyanoexosortase A system-associated protein [Anabaena azotica FACHB-119]
MFISSQKLKEARQAFLLRFQPLLQTQYFYLLGIFTTLAVLHLNIVSNHPLEDEETTFYALYWAGIIFLLWQNRQQETTTTWFSSFLGLGLLFLVILRPIYLWYLDLFLFRFGPIVAALGLGLLSFGFAGLRHYWRLFLLLCLMLVPYGFINEIFAFRLHFSELTAAISAFALHYIGLKATVHGAFVKLPTGQVEVLYYCTGGMLILWLLKLTLLIIVVVPSLSWRQRCGLVISAFCTGFLVGCIRVALLAVVVNNHSLFDYWHNYKGGAIFMATATITYAILCNWILPLELLSSEEQPDSNTKAIVEPKRRFFLATTWLSILLTSIYLIASKRPVTNSIFPNTIPVNSWKQVNVKSWNQPKSDTPVNTKVLMVLSGKDYSYIKNSQSLELQMRYVINTRGEPNPFLQQLSKNLFKDNLKNIKYVKGIGYYTLYSDSKQAYLTACINPRGGSTVTSNQFMQNRYTYDLAWNRLLPWIFGQEVLRDNRCIWTQVSIPLNGAVDSSVYPILESFWAENYVAWQSLLLAIY